MKFILVFIFAGFFTYAQKSEIDSLKQKIKNKDYQALSELIKDEKVVDSKSHPAFLAISENQIDVLKWMLEEEKIQTGIKNEFGKTLLHYAAIVNNVSAVELLLQHKVPADSLDRQKSSPLLYSIRKSYPDKKQRQNQFKIIKALVENKVDVSRQNQFKDDALMMAAYNGNLQVVKFLLDQKSISLKNKNIYNQTALHSTILGAMAQKKGNPEFLKLTNYQSIVRLLIKKGIDINAVDSETRTAFHYMAEHGFNNMLTEMLKQKNILVNLQTKEGWSALHLSAGNRSVESIKLLISNGADVNLKDKTDMTPIYLAVGSGSKEAVALFLKSKAHIFFKDKHGKDIFDSQTSKKLQGLISKLKGSS